MHIYGRAQQARRAAIERWNQSSAYDKTIFSLVLAYVALTAVYLLWHRTFLAPDQFFVLVLVATILLRRAKAFLLDWLPLVVLLFGYEYVRGLVPLINDHVHFQQMIDFDVFVFGKVPTVTLQSRYFNADSPQWYDYAAVILYLAHFVVPLGAAFLLWLQDRKMFREYGAGLLILSYLAYVTYMVFPAAPPWLAAQAGLLPPVNRILGTAIAEFRDPIALPTIYAKFGINMVAAVPSLHAAYPLITALFVGEKAPKLIPLLTLYVIGVWMAVIYLGEHYVFDVFAGAVYAVAAYGLVAYWPVLRKALAAREMSAVEVSQTR